MHSPINDAILAQARAAIVPAGATLPRGPALVYMAWSGPSCGSAHNFEALKQAAVALNVPLYVVNGSPGQKLQEGLPGTVLEVNTHAALFAMQDKYSFQITDPRVRLIGRNGDPVGLGANDVKDLRSSDGRDAIVNTLELLVQQMRAQQSSIGAGYGRA